jgi:glycosyltransferase involved in cell wall biosynthesis
MPHIVVKNHRCRYILLLKTDFTKNGTVTSVAGSLLFVRRWIIMYLIGLLLFFTERDSNLRVLMISKACIVGAYQKKLEEIARFPNVELTVVVPPYWRDERGVTRLEREHTQGYELVVERMALNGYFHLHFYPSLAKHFRGIKPHIVHIDEEPYNVATWQAMRLAKMQGAKAVFFTWQNIHRRYPPPFSIIESYNLRNADYAIAGNSEAVRVLKAKGYRGPARVIPQFGVDPDAFKVQKSQIANRKPVLSYVEGSQIAIGYVGRLVEEKGVHILLRAVADLSGEWRLRILGSGPQRTHLERLAEELGIAGRMRFEDPIPSTQMPGYYSQLDALVLPSLTRPNWKEQFGRVLIEAMACGVPVVGSDSGEIPSVIGEAGLVFPEGDVQALRAKLSQLVADPALRDELARRGRDRVLTHYTQAQVAAKTYQVYSELLGRA